MNLAHTIKSLYRKQFSIVVVPHTHRNTTIQFNYLTLIALIALLVFSLGTLIFFFLTYGGLVGISLRVEQLEERNSWLEKENKKVMELSQRLDELVAIELRIRNMAVQGSGITPQVASFEEFNLEMLNSHREGATTSPTANSELNDLFKRQELLLKATPSIWPMKGFVTREFIENENGVKGHYGIDIASKKSTPIRSTADGVVSFAGWDEDLGNMVIIDHGFGFKTIYGHASSIAVRKGTQVLRGSTIAFVGSTGESTAPHLHYGIEVRKNYVDPREYLP